MEQLLTADDAVRAPRDLESSTPPVPLRPTATARDSRSGLALDRCAYTTDMVSRLARESLEWAESAADEPPRTGVLSPVEVEVVAELLDELAGVYPGEVMGQLAGSLSARLWERATP